MEKGREPLRKKDEPVHREMWKKRSYPQEKSGRESYSQKGLHICTKKGGNVESYVTLRSLVSLAPLPSVNPSGINWL